MKFPLGIIFLFMINCSFGQHSFKLKVDSLYSEITGSFQTTDDEMIISINEGKLIFSGYDQFMTKGKSTRFILAQELGEGEKTDDYTYYSSWLYYNNPSPDCNLIIYEYSDSTVTLVIKTAVFITKYFCTKKE